MKKLTFTLVFIALGIVTIFSFAPKAHAALAFVSSSTASSTTSGRITTSTISATVGNLLTVACVETGGGSDLVTSTATSSDNIIFTQYAFVTSTAFGGVAGFYGIASTTASITIGCNFAASSTDRVQAVMQYSGNATTSILDTTSTALSAASITSSTIIYSTTNANDVIVSYAYANSDGSITSVASPFTSRFLKVGLFGFAGADMTTSTLQTSSTMKWTFASSPFVNILASFKAAPTVTTQPTPFDIELAMDW